jgi:type II secretory pathway component PulK
MIRSRSGMALVGAMFALTVIGALVAGSFFAGWMEQQSGQNLFFAAQAREAAEAGLARSALDPASLASLPVGAPAHDLGVAAVGEGTTVHTSVSRLTGDLFLLRAQGFRLDAAGTTLATRTLGLLLRLESDDADTTAAATLPQVVRVAERAWMELD